MHKKLSVAAFDYSMRSPALCIKSLDIDGNCTRFFYNVNSLTAKYAGTYKHGNDVVVIEHLDTTLEGVAFFNLLAEKFVTFIEQFQEVYGQIDLFLIEDYSMGSKGLIFNIAENTGVLKVSIFNKFKAVMEAFAPMSIKAYAGSGKADKNVMADFFHTKNGYHMYSLVHANKADMSPPSDLVDAAFIADLGIEFLQGTYKRTVKKPKKRKKKIIK